MAYYGSPFEARYVDSKTDQRMISYSGGIGYRAKKYYIDLGFVTYNRGEGLRPYTISTEATPLATIKKTESRVVTTFGWKF